KVTENERELLVTLAAAYGINDERIKQIEANFVHDKNEDIQSLSSPDEIVLTSIPEISVIQQWTDDSGYTWRKMSNGATQWWNGTEWINYNSE
ncbi:MAG: hypothetical protein VX439_00730, partial [Candidatus Thermoplasmatota archaeon]|nr:hypothetical protein [Candidatus Thermoplasmatota archaeon]